VATVNLLPNADVSNSPAWTLSTGSDVYDLLNDDDTGNPASDGSQITATAPGKKCEVQFTDFDNTGVASIDSVQGIVKVGLRNRGQNFAIAMGIGSESGAVPSWNDEVQGDSASVGWMTHTFTARTTSSSGGSAWTDTDLDNLTMSIFLDTLSGGTLRVTYAYFLVTYTEAAVAADNATFFGANF